MITIELENTKINSHFTIAGESETYACLFKGRVHLLKPQELIILRVQLDSVRCDESLVSFLRHWRPILDWPNFPTLPFWWDYRWQGFEDV